MPAPSLIAEAGLELLRTGQLAHTLRVSGLRALAASKLERSVQPIRLGRSLAADALDRAFRRG